MCAVGAGVAAAAGMSRLKAGFRGLVLVAGLTLKPAPYYLCW